MAAPKARRESDLRNFLKIHGLKSIPYQRDVLINKLHTVEKTGKPVVLAAAPSAGKTFMAIYHIYDYLKANPNAKVLILTHGTSILRTQFYDALVKYKAGFHFAIVENRRQLKEAMTQNARAIIALPQTLRTTKNLPHFDLLVFDEAHHFYLEPMVQQIVGKIKPKHTLLLTGTPSVYVAMQYPIIPVSVATLLDNNMAENINIEICGSSYNFGYKDYNALGELKSTIQTNDIKTQKTLNLLLANIIKRLLSTHRHDTLKYSQIKKASEWKEIIPTMGKTLFACRTQQQAKQVHNYLLKHGVGSLVSTVDFDRDSTSFKRFVSDKDINVLIVVYRGILGFNMPELETVVDMTASQNIDRLFQLMCRLLRKHPDGKQKIFFKIAPTDLEDYFTSLMNGVLCLTEDEFYTKYNGKNFGDFPIPVKRENRDKRIGCGYNKALKLRTKNIESIKIPSIDFFIKINKGRSQHFDSYAFTTFRQVRDTLLSKKTKWAIEDIFTDARKYKTKNEWRINSAGAVNAAVTFGIYDKCTEHMDVLMGKWTRENVLANANKYKTFASWYLHEGGAVAAARRLNIYDKCTEHMSKRRRFFWTEEKVLTEAKKYKTRAEWGRKDSCSESAAIRLGIIDKCIKHMDERPLKWTRETILNSAKECKTRMVWMSRYPSAYNKSKVMGIRNECTKHMKRYQRSASSNYH